MLNKESRIAPKGKAWVCLACGKTSKDCYGTKFPKETSRGWDESCVLNAQLFDKDKLVFDIDSGRVTQVKE